MAALRRDLEARLDEIDGVVRSESMFGHGDAYWVNGKEVAHFEGDGVIEVRLTRQVIRDRRPAFRADDRVQLRPSGADWITVQLARRRGLRRRAFDHGRARASAPRRSRRETAARGRRVASPAAVSLTEAK